MEGCTMGQVLHGSATTTEAIRRAIQHSQESLRTLARRYGINPKTVAKWKKRGSVADLPTGPEAPEVHGAVDRGGGDRRRLPPAHAPAARRLPLCLAADDPASDPLVAASLPAASRHLAACRRSTATRRPSASSRPTRSATSTSTSPRFAPRRASSISSWRSTALPSLPSLRCMRRPIGRPPPLPGRPDRSRALPGSHRAHR